jgi:alpha-glucosidase
LKSISIELGIVDLWNPEARTWLKNIIRTNLIEEAGAWGWMHDFGEYMPFDAYSFCGKDPFLLHNEYPDQWTRVVEEAIKESNIEHGD